MADIAYREEFAIPRHRTDWGAIWGGLFVFLSIWAVFGALGLAIFASTASPNATNPVLGMSWGIGAWFIVLTIIAFYVAGRETGHLAAVNNRHDGLVHGLIMFGLSFAALVMLFSIGGRVLTSSAAGIGGVRTSYLISVFTDLGWIGFVGLFLGWLAAMFGASSGVLHKADRNVREIRPAA